MRLLVCVAGITAAVAGCGGSTIDGGQLEDEIVDDAEAAGLVLDGADCPSPDVEEGDTFSCTVTVKGEERPLEVTQRNDDGNVEYDLGPLLTSSVGKDAGGDEASVRSTVDAVRGDITALCDYATPAFRRELAKDENCAKAVLAKYDDLLGEYEVSLDEDDATASDGSRTVVLERQRDGSWLITDVR
jgi:hypothetical protein